MPRVSKVNINDLVEASKRYIDAQLQKADVNKNKVLTKLEAKKLAADLKDNFDASQFKLGNGSVRAGDVAKEFVVMMEAWAKAADSNHDGALSTAEVKKLPSTLRDNVLNYITAQSTQVVNTGGYISRDVTPPGRAAEHERAFGVQAVDYKRALAIALKAVATDGQSGLAGFAREFGGPEGEGLDDSRAIARAAKAALKAGTVQLIAKDEEIPTGEVSRDAWIFSVSTDLQGDHGLWAVVDRKTGDVSVTNFN